MDSERRHLASVYQAILAFSRRLKEKNDKKARVISTGRLLSDSPAFAKSTVSLSNELRSLCVELTDGDYQW